MARMAIADLNILPAHEQLIREVAGVQPNVVVVLANSDAVVMPWLGECRALLETFFAGQGMGRAVAEILFGKRNPCGKLTVTVPNTRRDACPAAVSVGKTCAITMARAYLSAIAITINAFFRRVSRLALA